MPSTNTAAAPAQIEERDARSKPRTLIRMLSTKFTPRAAVSAALRSPPAAPSAYSKEQREAALRARGLLPPLPNKDLSTQEKEQDKRIPVMPLSESDKPAVETSVPSAADLIKKQWVAKNHADEGKVAEVGDCRSGRPDQAVSRATTSELASSSELGSPTSERPSSLLADLSEDIHAFMFPILSPSPSPKSDSNDDKTGETTGSCTPRPPASSVDVEPENASQAEPTLLRPGNRDSCGGQTEESHSDASIMTPSLDSTSQTASSSSHASAAAATSSSSRGGLDAVRIASPMTEHQFVFNSEELGVVLEEDSRPPSPSLLPKSSPVDARGVKSRDDPHTHSVSGGTDMASANEPAGAATAKAKAKAPKPAVERKRSMNPFKRAVTVSGAHSGSGKASEDENASADSPATPRRRGLTVGSSASFSMAHLRRSVVGSLSMHKASAGTPSRGKTFDASHLPPSPTSPTGPAVPVHATARVRRPQPVVMYNRGSILLEAAGIEDEETRRMTELAFLG